MGRPDRPAGNAGTLALATLTSWTWGVDPYLTLGISGTAAAAVIFARGKGRLADDTAESAAATAATQPFSTVLRHGARETSFVVVWVAVAYVAWALLHVLTGFDGTQLPVLGMTGVVVGALAGLVPGCAVQIVFTGLFVSGVVPLPTLLANAVSQDGDALLPLIALDKHSALVATCITTVPGLVVGTVVYLLA
ncbi:MAG TPA: putative manganese transporter [Nocardioidaceae bacterium]|nr:putative manganese transporter [Nocardioidaceae bacterium]